MEMYGRKLSSFAVSVHIVECTDDKKFMTVQFRIDNALASHTIVHDKDNPNIIRSAEVAIGVQNDPIEVAQLSRLLSIAAKRVLTLSGLDFASRDVILSESTARTVTPDDWEEDLNG